MEKMSESMKRRANEITEDLLPTKSRKRYDDAYEKFVQWLNEEKIVPTEVCDEILLVYLSNLSKVCKASTVWSKFSMIKSCLNVKHNIDPKSFTRCTTFLKKFNVNYEPKKSNVLTGNEVVKFMKEAPDSEWLLTKAIMALGIFGACRRDDLLQLNVDDIKDNGSFIVVFLEEGKTHSKRSFTITDEDCPFSPCELIRKYISLRPSTMISKRLFIKYNQGKCSSQHVGKNTIAAVPKKVAQYLGLDKPESYTGHALRRTSASMLVEGGGDLLTLKRHGGWKSSSVAEGYIEDSIARKVEVSKKLFNSIDRHTTSSTITSNSEARALDEDVNIVDENKNEENEEENRDSFFTLDNIFGNKNQSTSSTGTAETVNTNNLNLHVTSQRKVVESARGFMFSNNHNCTFNFYLNNKE
ncbi:uncharacterized protein LOC120350644 [Nilaparvata lugens]|uniref:uncharacterized protein LOC120350644 n=1 Tax=Nilaparvata lugens TaxID=108931 RepID=UPI00193E6F3F|nr:uncharacterized protein LOC120350644 [Nilaparvata lugens]